MFKPTPCFDGTSAASIYAFFLHRVSALGVSVEIFDFLKFSYLAGCSLQETIAANEGKNLTQRVHVHHSSLERLLESVKHRLDAHEIPVAWHDHFRKELEALYLPDGSPMPSGAKVRWFTGRKMSR